jgi:hypothetical protein
MNAVQYVTILTNNLQTSANKMSLTDFVFQQDNDPKHTSAHTCRFFERKV